MQLSGRSSGVARKFPAKAVLFDYLVFDDWISSLECSPCGHLSSISDSMYEYVIADGKYFGFAHYIVSLHLLISAIVAWNNSGTKRKWAGVAIFQYNIIYQNKLPTGLGL